jgi:hypothetical protein
MVTHAAVKNLMLLITDLSYVYERCRAALITPIQPAQVKGENLILEVLRRQLPLLKQLSDTYSNLGNVYSSVKDTIIYLDRKYPEKSIFLGPQVNLDRRDAEKLSKDSKLWIEAIIEEYSYQRTVLIREENISKIFSKELLSNLDELTGSDLSDAFSCILNLLPTPAAMICFRATENIIRSYYTKITGVSAKGKSWKKKLDELEKVQGSNRPLIGYLDYLRGKRNEAEHPDKRFSQEESERILLHVKGLLEELNKISEPILDK